MENINHDQLNKYQVTVHSDMDDEFMGFVPSHRVYINSLIEKNILDYYTVSMESQKSWMVINAASKRLSCIKGRLVSPNAATPCVISNSSFTITPQLNITAPMIILLLMYINWLEKI